MVFGGVGPLSLVSLRARQSAYSTPAIPVYLYLVTLVAAGVYAAFFSWLSIQRYDAFLMHALDMGNMDQAVWNTLHGHPFQFSNMRAHLAKEAWGTTTRLSFHVEPILLPLSLVYLIHAAPQTLIVVQAVAVALGAPAACRLALRVTGNPALALVAPFAYLLSPSLQAATLYEFHPVTLAAPALLWAIVFLEERRYWLFALFAVLAIACKEEIGLVVAGLALWDWWRGGSRRVAVITVGLAAGWSLLAIGAIVPHFASGPSAYWQRYIDAGANGGKSSAGASSVLREWLHHPGQFVQTLFIWPKASMLHRYLISTGYLALFGLPLLAVSLPSFAIILLSTDQHMYGGLGQYSAELVPIGVAASIYGFAWLLARASRRNLSTSRAARILVAWFAIATLLNQFANGFTPLAADYAAPAVTLHDRLGLQLLKLIPPGAPVSSMDQIDPHLGDRAKSYLFPNVEDAEYVALDVTTNINPGSATDQYRAAMELIRSRHWQILAASDGYLIMHKIAGRLQAVPKIPAAFYTFAVSADDGTAPALASFGPNLQLVGVAIDRREQVNLRVPDVVLTTSWRVLRPLPASTRLVEVLTNTAGKINNNLFDRPTTDWLPMSQWRPGEIVHVQSIQISFVDTVPGYDALRLLVQARDSSGQQRAFAPRLGVVHNNSDYKSVNSMLEVARIRVSF